MQLEEHFRRKPLGWKFKPTTDTTAHPAGGYFSLALKLRNGGNIRFAKELQK